MPLSSPRRLRHCCALRAVSVRVNTVGTSVPSISLTASSSAMRDVCARGWRPAGRSGQRRWDTVPRWSSGYSLGLATVVPQVQGGSGTGVFWFVLLMQLKVTEIPRARRSCGSSWRGSVAGGCARGGGCLGRACALSALAPGRLPVLLGCARGVHMAVEKACGCPGATQTRAHPSLSGAGLRLRCSRDVHLSRVPPPRSCAP